MHFRGGKVLGHSNNLAGVCVEGAALSSGSTSGDSIVGVGVVGEGVCEATADLPGS